MLIYKDEKKIKQATEFLKSSIKFLNAIYAKFSGAGIMLALDQLAEIVNTLTLPYTKSNWLESYLSDIGCNADQIEMINGKKFTLVNLIPSAIIIHRVEPILLEIQNGKIIVANGALNIIERRFSISTNNQKGAELAAKLLVLANALNDHARYLGVFTLLEMPLGIEFANLEYRPDVSFIRSHELKPAKPVRERAYQ